ncbi:Nucleoside phosphorylase [Tistlia consotensis]|uniref:Nucleoside phosphorylase n=1 Tax=Tistlia consotensis USBA 355 TaxID=560819 RepID=A0A1Y6CUT8_9PROT|nr:Nucleoside phosphorylase [Tistlia consotensis USBA 355]SNS16812.1 Nucleoside phosphorylase [Tistlia consotensis]
MKPGRPALRVPVLILSVIIDPEHRRICDLLPQAGLQREPETETDRLLEIERWHLKVGPKLSFEVATAFINGMGNARSAMETLLFLERISPKFIFLCGIAGSLCPDRIRLGDVVVARQINWWNLNKLTREAAKVEEEGPAKYLSLGDHFFRKDIRAEGKQDKFWDRRLARFVDDHQDLLRSNIDRRLLALRSELQADEPYSNRLHCGDIVSWEYVLSDSEVRDAIFHDPYGGKAIEMEGAGFAAAVARRNEEVTRRARAARQVIESDTVGFVFRGITDLCHDKGSEPQEWREVAMFNAAQAVIDFLKRLSPDDFRR